MLTPVANYGTIHGHCSQQSALLLPQYGVGRIFSQRGELRNFSRKAKKIFLKMAKRGEISFFLFETKRSTIFAKKVLGKYQNENPRGH